MMTAPMLGEVPDDALPDLPDCESEASIKRLWSTSVRRCAPPRGLLQSTTRTTSARLATGEGELWALPGVIHPGELLRLLGQHGLNPDRVDNVETAWTVFGEFLAQPIDGLAAGERDNADGFIVQWGRYSWHDRLPGLSFTRQFAVDVRDGGAESDGSRPDYWQVSLDLVFPDAPAFADLDQLHVRNMGFDFGRPGPERSHAIGEAKRKLYDYPALQALWTTIPLRSAVTLDPAD